MTTSPISPIPETSGTSTLGEQRDHPIGSRDVTPLTHTKMNGEEAGAGGDAIEHNTQYKQGHKVLSDELPDALPTVSTLLVDKQGWNIWLR